MVPILVVLTIVLFLLADWILGHRVDQEETAAPAAAPPGWTPDLSTPIQVAGFKVQMEMSFHPGHSWAFEEAPAHARVGLDDFAQRLIGNFDSVTLPEIGDRVVQGKPACAFVKGDRHASVLSPVTGEVVAVNERLRAEPRLLSEAPYADGWLFSVRSPDIGTSFNNLLKGDLVRKWMETTAAQLRAQWNHGFALSFPDGGPAVADIGALANEEQWKRIIKEFLLTA